MVERRKHFMLWLLVALVMSWTACGDGGTDRVVTNNPTKSGCVTCHLDESALKLLAVEEELPEDTGEG